MRLVFIFDVLATIMASHTHLSLSHSQVFDGPISESIPSSTVSFIHRRSRGNSDVSGLDYHHDEEDSVEWPTEDLSMVESNLGEDDDEVLHDLSGPDLRPDRASLLSKRKPHHHSSLEEPLLPRQMSTGSFSRDHRAGNRSSQKIYMRSEDLSALFTGYSTSVLGFVSYVILCTVTLGIAYLFFRWLPHWRIRLVGKRSPFSQCQWIAVKVSRPAYSALAQSDGWLTDRTHNRTNMAGSICAPFILGLMGV